MLAMLRITGDANAVTDCVVLEEEIRMIYDLYSLIPQRQKDEATTATSSSQADMLYIRIKDEINDPNSKYRELLNKFLGQGKTRILAANKVWSSTKAKDEFMTILQNMFGLIAAEHAPRAIDSVEFTMITL